MPADCEIRTSAGALLRTTPDKTLAHEIAAELAEQFDVVSVHRVVRIERREIIGEFLSERARRERAA
jgi:hypothetical protein